LEAVWLDPTAEEEAAGVSGESGSALRVIQACLWRGDAPSVLSARADGVCAAEELTSHAQLLRNACATVLAFHRMALAKKVERDSVCFLGDSAAVGLATAVTTLKPKSGAAPGPAAAPVAASDPAGSVAAR
jgi:hypothetical protein